MTDTPPPVAAAPAPKSKTAFIVLAILLGELGIHNFYIGNTKRGVIQLLVSVLTCFIGALPMWIWAVVEAFTVKKDAQGVDFN
ncbi:MAG: TM2 domain-containing protein [Opitutales bacterium]|jgi:TM2 domain-containing membrane protein YozV